MGWVRDGVRFPERMKRFLLPTHQLMRDDLLRLLDVESPEALEAVLRSVIKEKRPELANCTVLAMQMNYEYGRWEVLTSDQSFPPIESGCKIECEHLERI